MAGDAAYQRDLEKTHYCMEGGVFSISSLMMQQLFSKNYIPPSRRSFALQDVVKKCLTISFVVAAVHVCKSRTQPPFVIYQCIVIVSVLALLIKAIRILAVFGVDKAQ
jgi:F0F1-type ATP synthase assembly protein I